MRQFLTLASAVMLAACASGGGTSTSPPPPSSTVMLGVHFAGSAETDLAGLEKTIGHKLLDSDYDDCGLYDKASNPQGFPDTDRIASDKAAGRPIMISWRTHLSQNNTSACSHADIVAGKYDAQFVQQAKTLAATGYPVLVRWHYEFTDNADDTPFNDGVPVANDMAKAGANYIAAWNHIRPIFAKYAPNAQFVWAPSCALFGKAAPDASTWKLFWPGAANVDWIACDHYNKGSVPESYATAAPIANFYGQTASLGKPLMQSETSAGSTAQAEWIATAQQALDTKYPAFRAWVWWNVGYGNAPGDTYTLTPSTGLPAFTTMANDPHFAGVK